MFTLHILPPKWRTFAKYPHHQLRISMQFKLAIQRIRYISIYVHTWLIEWWWFYYQIIIWFLDIVTMRFSDFANNPQKGIINTLRREVYHHHVLCEKGVQQVQPDAVLWHFVSEMDWAENSWSIKQKLFRHLSLHKKFDNFDSFPHFDLIFCRKAAVCH